MTLNEIKLEKAILTRDWYAGRMQRMQALRGAVSVEDTEEAIYLFRMAELDVKEAELVVND